MLSVSVLQRLIVIMLFTGLSGCRPSFDHESEFVNLDYAAFVDHVGLEIIDPRGASDISIRYEHSRDTYDCWMKMQIKPKEYQALLDHLESSHRDNFDDYMTSTAGIPDNWPDSDAPGWWVQSSHVEEVQCHWWERQTDSRAEGLYVVYDQKSKALWFWEWNHQHFELGD